MIPYSYFLIEVGNFAFFVVFFPCDFFGFSINLCILRSEIRGTLLRLLSL